MRKGSITVCSIIFCICISANIIRADGIYETEAEKQERVYKEVLTGNITNDEDVIRVALKQYAEKEENATSSKQSMKEDYLSVTQTIGEKIEGTGNVVEEIVSTGLVIVDENQRRVPIDEIETGSGQLSQYSIYATMTVNVTNDRQTQKARLNFIETKLNYGTSMKAGSLVQFLWYSDSVIGEAVDKKKTTSSPNANYPYRYYPTYTSMLYYSGMNCHLSPISEIHAGNDSMIIRYTIDHWNPGGAWYDRISH